MFSQQCSFYFTYITFSWVEKMNTREFRRFPTKSTYHTRLWLRDTFFNPLPILVRHASKSEFYFILHTKSQYKSYKRIIYISIYSWYNLSEEDHFYTYFHQITLSLGKLLQQKLTHTHTKFQVEK